MQKVLEDASVFTVRKIGGFSPLSSIDLLIKKCFEIDFLRYKEEHKTDKKKSRIRLFLSVEEDLNFSLHFFLLTKHE